MCSNGRCGTAPSYNYGDSYDNNYSYPLGDFVLVYKLPRYIPDRLRERNLDLAYDTCYNSYRLIKRRVDDHDSDSTSTEYINIGGTKYKCTCKENCMNTTCVCIKCRDMERICRKKKYYIKKNKKSKCSCSH